MKKRNKVFNKCVALLLIAGMTFSLVACDDKDDAASASGGKVNSVVTKGVDEHQNAAKNEEKNKAKSLDSEYDSKEYYNSIFTETYGNKAADKDSNAKSATIMIYMCGSDLESEYGAATMDLTEMMYSEMGDKVKVVVQTGGASEWQNEVVGNKSLERYLVSSEGIEQIGDAGKGTILDSGKLADFIKFAEKEYPADRYGFIFWNHGGGTIGGYGHDENYTDATMSIDDINKGFKKAGLKFDFIGFDCCLMGTVEVAKMLVPYADYLIASEETEPGTGWYYTDFLTELENNPGMSMKALGKQIIKDFCSTNNTDESEITTLSLIDLKAVDELVDSLYTYMDDAETFLKKKNGFEVISKARKGAKNYGDGQFEQIDMVDFLDRTEEVKSSKDLKEAIANCVLFNGSRDKNSNGLAMYFPYSATSDYSKYNEVINSVGLSGDSYNLFLNDFVTIKVGGHSETSGNNPYSSEETEYNLDDIVSEEWYDEDLASEYEDYYSNVSTDDLEITEKDGVYVLQLSDDDWDIVTDVEKQVYVDDGEGYLMLGSDDFVEYDEDGDLVVEYDYQWLYINECLIPYYFSETVEKIDGSLSYQGYAPALLNGDEEIDVWVSWDEEGNCKVLGYKQSYSDVATKGYYQFADGDSIDFLFSYYDYDGEYLDDYILDDNTLVYHKKDTLDVYYDDIGDCNVQVTCYLQDIYENEYWTEPLDYTM